MSEVRESAAVVDGNFGGVADAVQPYDFHNEVASAEHPYQAYLDQIPNDWTIRTLGDLATVVGGGTPSREAKSFWNGDIPWVTPGEVSKEQSKYLKRTAEQITALGLGSSGANLLPAGALLVTTRATLGARVIAAVPMATNQGFKSLVFPAAGDANFYYYMASKLKPELVRRASGTTFLEISSREFSRIEVPCPSPGERQQIARVLDNLDTAIRQTEAIIAKLKQIKQGLLHDLLTRGINANGELRPPQPQAPHLYKQSLLGWIPKEWGLGGLASVASHNRSVIRTGPFGSSLKGEHWRETGAPVITIGSLGDGVFFTSELLFVDNATANRLADFSLMPGDLVFSRVADVGRSVVITEAERGWIMSSNFMRISCDVEKVRPRFLQMLLSSSTLVRRQLRTTVNSAGRDVANSSVLLDLRFPWPSPGEQDQILRKVLAQSESVAAEDMELAKLIDLKNGLMDDLLTGRVRVTPLLEVAATL
jgi:type I restriction enzyme S subunit